MVQAVCTMLVIMPLQCLCVQTTIHSDAKRRLSKEIWHKCCLCFLMVTIPYSEAQELNDQTGMQKPCLGFYACS